MNHPQITFRRRCDYIPKTQVHISYISSIPILHSADLNQSHTLRVVYHQQEQSTGAWKDKFRMMSQLREGWNGYKSPPPNATARALAENFVETLLRERMEPSKLAPSVLGGVGLTRRNRDRRVYVEFFNNGQIYAMFSDGNSEPISRPVTAGLAAFKKLIAEMREYLDA